MRLFILNSLIFFFYTATLSGQNLSPTHLPDSLRQQILSKQQDSSRIQAALSLTKFYATKNKDSSYKYVYFALELSKKHRPALTNESQEVYNKLKGEALFNIACLYHMHGDFSKAEDYYDEAISVQRKAQDLSALAKSLNYVSRIYQGSGQHLKFLETSKKALAIQQKIGDSSGVALSLIAIGDQYARNGEPDSCLNMYQEALTIYRNIGKNTKRLAFCLFNLGIINEKRGEIELAIQNSFEALEIQNKIEDKQGAINTLLSLGLLFKKQGDLKKAEKYYLKVLDLNQELQSKMVEAKAYNNLGGVYHDQKKYRKSLAYYLKSNQIIESINGSPSIKAISLNNIAEQYLALEIMDSALYYMKHALEKGKNFMLPEHKAKLLLSIGKHYYHKNRLQQAENHMTQSLAIAEEIGFPENLMEVSNLLASLSEKQENYKKALKYFKVYAKMKDSITNTKFNRELIEQEALYEVKRREDEILLNEKEIEILKKDKQLNRRTVYSMISGFILLLLISILSFKYYHQKRNISEQNIRNQLVFYIKEIQLLKNQVNHQLIEGNFSKDEDSGKILKEYLDVQLSKRETEVLVELSKGKSNKEISDTLHISVNTVRTHLLNIYNKLDVNNRTQAVKKAGNLSLIEPVA